VPTKGQETLPDRSRPETTGRALSLDEKKSDVQTLRNLSGQVGRLGEAFVRIFDQKTRGELAEAVERLQAILNNQARIAAEEVRNEIFAQTGDKAGKMSGQYRGGKTGTRGGPKL
jgi:hypothetical protein